MKDLVVFGAGGHAREIHQLIEDLNADKPTWNFLGFLDGGHESQGKRIHDLPVLGDARWLAGRSSTWVVVGIGGTAARRKVVRQIVDAGCRSFATLVHPLAWRGANVSIGEGSMVCAGVRLTTDIRVGSHVILNVGCTVSHDAILEDYVTLAPGVNVAGAAAVGTGCDLGINCAVLQHVSIGGWSVVGAGAVVVKDLPANVTAVGVPAKVIKERPEGWYEE